MLGVALLVAGGCHGANHGPPAGGPPEVGARPAERLPIEPLDPDSAVQAGTGSTITRHRAPRRVSIEGWQLASPEFDDGYEVWFLVPLAWDVDLAGGASDGSGLVRAEVDLTPLEVSDVPIIEYARQLAEDSPLSHYTTADGASVYVTRREVSVAPSDPDAAREVFHTAIVSLDGRIAKLDVRYAADVDWRFNDLALAITGTVQVRRTP